MKSLIVLACELTREGMKLLRNINRIMDDPDLLKFCAKVVHLGNSTWVPPAGSLNNEGVAALFGINKTSADELIKRNNIPTFRPGNQILVRMEDLQHLCLRGGEAPPK